MMPGKITLSQVEALGRLADCMSRASRLAWEEAGKVSLGPVDPYAVVDLIDAASNGAHKLWEDAIHRLEAEMESVS